MDSKREYRIKNMVCRCCLKVIRQELEEIKVTALSLELGKHTVHIDADIDKKKANILHENGFEIAKNEEEIVVEKIKIIIEKRMMNHQLP